MIWKTFIAFCLYWLSTLYPVAPIHAIGMYGVSNNPPELTTYGITKVWGPAKKEWIASQTAQQREVFLTLNVFGGSAAWQQFPDSRPIIAEGTELPKKHGGVCPSHRKWRQTRLNLLQKWLDDFAGEGGISGVWLDFIRYPGQWETANPAIPKTCYCARCIHDFQQQTQTIIPEGLDSTKEKEAWIQTYAAEKWHAWKKEQILSFVQEAREIIDTHNKKRPAALSKIKLGVFLVPWRKSDFNGAISFSLAQDAELMAPYVDVFSPMVYHRMVQQPTSWPGEITRYFNKIGESAGVAIWPIIQSEDVAPDEFTQIIKETGQAGAQELLVYSLKQMQENLWPSLQSFSASQSLIPKLSNEVKELSLPLASCKPDHDYLFSAEFLRPDRENPHAYPEVSLWGKRYRLDSHRTTGKFQRIQTIVTCPHSPQQQKQKFSFTNRYPDTPFILRKPQLRACGHRNCRSTTPLTPALLNFFPLGVYGGNTNNIQEIKNIGCNTTVINLSRANVEKCLQQNMRCAFAVPHQPEKLIQEINAYGHLLKKGNFLFYVNDEPALRSAPEWQVEDIQRILKHHFPQTPTMMAIVRPQTIPFYENGADYFMMDQYPIPSMPMTWLSDSLDNAADAAGENRLMSVIQAFGGKDFANDGWPRLPTFTEMYNLAILSIIHGSRGVFFFTFPAITSTKQGKNDFSRVIRRLNSLRSWLTIEDETSVPVTMTSNYKFAPDGGKAVRCIAKKKLATKMLFCANTLPYSVRADVQAGSENSFSEYFAGEEFISKKGILDLSFTGLEVKILIEKEKIGKIKELGAY